MPDMDMRDPATQALLARDKQEALARIYGDPKPPPPAGRVEYRTREVYGRVLAYPVNQAAKIFAGLTGTTTLTRSTLDAATALGFAVVEVCDPREVSA